MPSHSFHLPLAAMILVAGTAAALFMPTVASGVLVTATAAIMAAAFAFLQEPEPAPVAAAAPLSASPPVDLFELPTFHTLIDHDARAIVGLSDMNIALANEAALTLLGRHIAGADIRTAMRHPAVIDALTGTAKAAGSEPVNLIDFQQAGDRWQLSIVALGGGQRLLLVEDRSAIDAADRMRSDFVANASHELRTPLAAILGYVETLRHMDPDEAEPVRERFLGIIEREAGRMQQLVADLISISRIEADRYRRPATTVDLVELVRGAAAEIAASGPPRAAELKLDLPAAAPLIGDAAQLTQLAHNIIGNAMKYGRSGTPVDVSITAEPAGWRLAVRDVGDGIRPEHLPRLTERFYRVDDARSRAVGGTGLGLAIVKHIAERHRARLAIESEVGQGTCVSVTFPLAGE